MYLLHKKGENIVIFENFAIFLGGVSVYLLHKKGENIVIFENFAIFLGGVSVYLLPNSLVILTFFVNFGLFHLWRRGWGGGRHVAITSSHSRTYCLCLHRFWPKLLCSVDMCPWVPHVHPHIFTFYFWRPEGPLWAPRSVGPYGVGRAPTPLMHAPCGGMHMGTPLGCPL